MSTSSGIDPNLTVVTPFPVAVITSRFNDKVTDLLRDQALERLRELGFPDHYVKAVTVPGAGEIPLLAKVLAKSRRYQAIITLGAVIRGETSHFDFVCHQVSQSCQRVMLEFSIPVIFGVLTTENEEQALARVNGKHSFKGREAVDAACEMVALLKELS